MRMEELCDGRYIKTPDAVERYLLNIVQQFFGESNNTIASSKEYIINQAVERIRQEINFDNIGVISITMPNGEVKQGSVSLSIEDFGGEPAIVPKLSAFNVNFGTEAGTACEGNDPRLSDARKPLDHTHEVDEIAGLTGILSSIQTEIERTNALAHEHSNKDVLDILKYSGNSTVIDLKDFETKENDFNVVADAINNNIIQYTIDTDLKIQDSNQKALDIHNDVMANITQEIENANQTHYDTAKAYMDQCIADTGLDLQQTLDALITAQAIEKLADTASTVYTLAGTSSVSIGTIFSSSVGSQSYVHTLPSNVLNELIARNAQIDKCRLEYYLEYTNNGVAVKTALPYFIWNNGIVEGSISVDKDPLSNDVIIQIYTATGTLPSNIQAATISCEVYSTQTVTI